MKSPPTYNELSVSKVTFGGYYTFATSELSTDKVLSRKGFQGCFSEAWFSQSWPADDASVKKVNFLDQNIPVVGTVKNFCEAPVPAYEPSFFPSSAVHISLIENYTVDSMKVELMFRTVIAEQVLTNYSTISTGESIQFRMDRKGRLEIAIDVPAEIVGGSNVQVIQTAKEDYHDGEWHSASFNIENKLNAENKFLGEFTVDGKTRLFVMSKKFFFNGYVNVGFGFTGCMKDIKINSDPVHKIRRDPKKNDEFFTINDIGVVHNQCSLKDYCNPNPCQNGGRCNQTEDNIVCACEGTLYEGSTCHRPRFNYTCAGVRAAGERRSDVYYIDFDGMGPMEPVPALCDLGKTIESTTTQINNTKFMDVDVATPSGKNDVDINYQASIIQMRELVMNSAFCEQYIKYTCKGTPLFRSPEGPPATSWMGGDDILHYYWGGAKNRRGYCACGLTQKCNNIGKYCNCDSLDPYNNIFDEGNFTVKEHLPVRQVKFTSVLEGSGEMFLRVGHLRCSGFGSRDIAATFRKPYSFLSVDHPDQPFDNIFAGELAFDFKTSVAYNYMVMAHAHGPFSGDYIKIMIWSRTLVRVHLNFGFGDLKQDVDIASTGRTLDDNQWHTFSAMFNMKELNVTLDGIMMIQGLPLQEDPVQFNVDDKSVYIGGSYHDPYGFVGCIRSLYVNGRIHDIRGIAEGQEDYGVYPGCGSACVSLNRPCNYGACIDEYDSFKCNCTVSPNSGKFCQNETYPKKFAGGNSITYDFEKGNQSHPIGELIITIGFNTDQADVALAQLEGQNSRHFSLALVDGFLTLYWTQKEKIQKTLGTTVDTETKSMQITARRLNNKRHNIARVRFSTEEIYLTVPNYEYMLGENITERFIDLRNKNLGMKKDKFGAPSKFTVGAMTNLQIDTQGATLPTTYTGCMSGAKLVYQPEATTRDRYPQSIAIDMFKLVSDLSSKTDTTLSGQFPTPNLVPCGGVLPTPGTLPTVGPARQFFTRSPGLDNSVRIDSVNMWNRLIIFVVVLIISVVLLLFLFIIYRYVNKSHFSYNRMRETEKPQKSQPMMQYKPAASSSQYNPPPQNLPPPSFSQPPPQTQYGESSQGGGGGDGFFL